MTDTGKVSLVYGLVKRIRVSVSNANIESLLLVYLLDQILLRRCDYI